mgnify:CR=1
MNIPCKILNNFYVLKLLLQHRCRDKKRIMILFKPLILKELFHQKNQPLGHANLIVDIYYTVKNLIG